MADIKDINFFPKIDLNKHGVVGSQLPAWYFDFHIDELRESIARQKRMLDAGRIPSEQIMYEKAQIEKMEYKLKEIEGSKPKLTDVDRNAIWKMYKSIGGKISSSLFTRSEMQLGLASPHEEAKRMIQPTISLDYDLISVANKCNIKVYNGKVARNDAAKMFKIFGKLINEPTNIEVLRKDKVTARTGYKTKAA